MPEEEKVFQPEKYLAELYWRNLGNALCCYAYGWLSWINRFEDQYGDPSTIRAMAYARRTIHGWWINPWPEDGVWNLGVNQRP
jgi:hypothetical protein